MIDAVTAHKVHDLPTGPSGRAGACVSECIAAALGSLSLAQAWPGVAWVCRMS